MELVIQAARAAEKRLDKELKPFGLTWPQFEALRLVRDMGGEVSLGQIAAQIGCSRGNLTGVFDRLERDGWIKRERSKEDRRVVRARLLRPERLAQVETAVAPLLGQAPPPAAEEYLGSVLAAAHG